MSDGLDALRVDLTCLDERLRGAVADICKDRTAPLSFSDLAEIVDAFDAGLLAHDGISQTDQQGGLLPRSVVIGEVVLHSPTIASAIKQEEINKWTLPTEWTDALLWVDRITAYVLAHSHDADVLRLLVTPEQTWALVNDWVLGLTCTKGELRAAVAQLTHGTHPKGDGEPEDKKKGFIAWNEIVLHLCREVGGTTHYWMYEVPEAHATWMLRAVEADMRAKAAAQNHGAAPGKHDPRIIAAARWKELETRLTNG